MRNKPHLPFKPLLGLTLVELLIVIAVVGLLIGLLLPALSNARRGAKTTVCTSNLRSMGQARALYATDQKDAAASLSWQPDSGPYPTDYADLRDSVRSPDRAVALQAVHLMRKASGVDEIPIIAGWVAPPLYTNLVLIDYLGGPRPNRSIVCPEDRNLILAQRGSLLNPLNPRAAEPDIPSGIPGRRGWGSSYQTVPAAWSNDHAVGQRCVNIDPAEWGSFLPWGSTGTFKIIGRRRVTDVMFPSSKVVMFDEAARHVKSAQEFYLYDDLWQPMLFFDGSARIKTIGEATRGANPVSPGSLDIHVGTIYGVGAGVGPSLRGGLRIEEFPYVPLMTTRMGLRGVDYGAADVVGP